MRGTSSCGMLRSTSKGGHMQASGCPMIRQGHLIAVVGAFLIAVVVVGCASGPGNNIDERGGEEGAAATDEETIAPEKDGSAARTTQEPAGLDAEVVSPLGQANQPAGFGEGSLWATGFDPSGAGCDDVKGVGEASASASSEAMCAASAPSGGPPVTLLKRVDPRSGEVVAKIPLERLNDVFMQVAFGAGSGWVSFGHYPI